MGGLGWKAALRAPGGGGRAPGKSQEWAFFREVWQERPGLRGKWAPTCRRHLEAFLSDRIAG